MEVLLDEVCGYLNNYFLVKPAGIHRGEFTVEDGGIVCDFLQEGQYFRIVNSMFNNGVYKYPATDLEDEVFTGEVWSMAVPPAFLSILKEIEDWQKAYGRVGSANMSPFNSESFNNYSYTKSGRSGTTASNGSAATGWTDVYGSRLTRWRKI